jgi:hypothetical protein
MKPGPLVRWLRGPTTRAEHLERELVPDPISNKDNCCSSFPEKKKILKKYHAKVFRKGEKLEAKQTTVIA